MNELSVVPQVSQNLIVQYKAQNTLYGTWVKSPTELTVVQTFDGKRIREYNSEDMAYLVELMAKWRFLLGATSDPTPEELTVICQFIYDNFDKLTYLDIHTAMNWAINGTLDMGFVMQKSLSTFYVAKAIRLYLAEKAEIVNKVARAKEIAELEQKNKQGAELTPQQRANNFKDHLLTVWKDYKENGYGGIYDIGGMVYDWLRRSRILTPSSAQIEEAMRFGNDKHIRERQEENLRNILSKSNDKNTDERTIKKYAREYLIGRFFDTVEINALLSKIHPSQFEKRDK